MEKVGYKTNQDMYNAVARTVGSAQFINTGLLLMLSEAALSPQGIPALSQIFVKGYYEDFTKGWYNIIGNLIVETMIINAILPILIEIFTQLRKIYLQKKDKLNCQEGYQTK